MAKINTAPVMKPVYTHEGALAAVHVSAREQLWRAIGATLLWEPQHYESGDGVARRILDLVGRTRDEDVAELARLARTRLKLRDTPLWMANALAYKHRKGPPIAPGLLSNLIVDVVRRPDQMKEMVAQYWTLNGRPLQTIGRGSPGKRLPWQMKVGLARAFQNFNEYRLAKWNRDEQVKLRDVLFLVHAKPRDEQQAALWKRLISDTMATPDTWEVGLSSGQGKTEVSTKKDVWERLLREHRLGYEAVLKNLRNMLKADVDETLIREALLAGAANSGALPYEFVSAARAVPSMESVLSEALAASTANLPKLKGRTLLVLDVSGSMNGLLSEKSKLNRLDAAGALAVATRALCERVTVYATAGSDLYRKHATRELPDRRGLGFLDAVQRARLELGGGGIFLTQCMDWVAGMELGRSFDRVLVFTDEVDCDIDPAKAPKNARKLAPAGQNYIMNIASYEHGIASDGGWERISGFSDGVLAWIAFNETGQVLWSRN